MGTEKHLPWRKVGSRERAVPEAEREKFRGGRGSVMSYAIEGRNRVRTEERPLIPQWWPPQTCVSQSRAERAEPAGGRGAGAPGKSGRPADWSCIFRLQALSAWVTFFCCPPPL